MFVSNKISFNAVISVLKGAICTVLIVRTLDEIVPLFDMVIIVKLFR